MATSACPVRGALRAQLRAARAFGLAPLRPHARCCAHTTHVALSPARALCGRLACALLAAAVVSGYVYETYQNVALHAVVFAHSKAWYLLTTAQLVGTVLVVALAGGDGAPRTARLLQAVRRVHEMNLKNDVYDPTRRGRGEALVWAVLVFGLAFEPTFLAVLSLTETGATLASCAFTFAANIVKVLLGLHYVCLVSFVNSSLSGWIELLNNIGSELNVKGDYDDKVYKRAYAGVRDAHCAYVALGRLVRATAAREGPALLLLLATNTLKAMHYLFLLQSMLGAAESQSAILAAVAACATTALVFEIVQTVLIVETCHDTTEKMLAMRPALAACGAGAAPRGPLAEACAAFYGCVRGAPPAFSPLGLCDLSRAFMLEVFGFCVTFAAIVRQFNLKDKESRS